MCSQNMYYLDIYVYLWVVFLLANYNKKMILKVVRYLNKMFIQDNDINKNISENKSKFKNNTDYEYNSKNLLFI